MPFYYFKCAECNRIQEELVKAETKETICKECAAPTKLAPDNLFSSPGLLNKDNKLFS